MNRFYQPWVEAGRHWANAPIVQIYHDAIRHAYPHAVIGTIGDERHLTAEVPEDHTPYSQTGWPYATRHGIVTALDVSEIPHLDALAMKWVNDARRGNAPWVKYVNFNGHQWSHADHFNAAHANPDYGHVHISFCTNHLNPIIGDYHILPIVTSHHTIIAGDTLAAIASDAGTTVDRLFTINGHELDAVAREHGEKDSHGGNLIYPGTVLDIP
jgi:hypothetical protein